MDGQVVVIGGGTAGLEAAGQLLKAGLNVTLVEKESEKGGNIRNWHQLFPDRRLSREVLDYLNGIVSGERLRLLLDTEVASIEKSGRMISVRTSGGGEVMADAVIVATGFDLFNCSRKEEYGYGIYDNVISSADLEKMFRDGSILLENGNTPLRIGLIHCVGSRDEKVGNLYCSKLCCVTAVKQAMEIREKIPESKVFCFYMDMRMGGAHYEELYRESQEKHGVSYIRGKVSEVGVNVNDNLIVKVEDTLAGRPLRMELDMVVLMTGMEMTESGMKFAEKSGLKTGENRFFEAADHHYGSNRSNIAGVFYAGTCTAPMNITETISHARAAAAEVLNYLGNGGKTNG